MADPADPAASPGPGPSGPAGRWRRHPVRWSALGVGVAGAALLVALVANVGGPPAAQRISADSPLLGKLAPAFSLPAISDHGRVSSAALAGHTIVINFWASWCDQCKLETPTLEAFYRRWHPQGVDLVGLSVEDTVGAERAFRREYKVTWPLALDEGGQIALRYGVYGIPETYVISPRGMVVAKLVGRIAPWQLDEVLRRLAEGSDPISASNPNFVPGPG